MPWCVRFLIELLYYRIRIAVLGELQAFILNHTFLSPDHGRMPGAPARAAPYLQRSSRHIARGSNFSPEKGSAECVTQDDDKEASIAGEKAR